MIVHENPIRRSSLARLGFLCLSVMYVAPVIVMIAWAAKSLAFRSIAALTLVAFLVAIIVAAMARRWSRFFLLQLPLSALSVGFVVYTVAFNMPPGHTLAQILTGASLEEMRGLLQFRLGLMLAVALIAWVAIYLWLCVLVPSTAIFGRRTTQLSRLIVIMLIPLTIYTAMDPAQMIDGAALDPIVGSLMFLGGQVPEVIDEAGGSRIVKRAYGASRSGSEEVHILVVGESARRDSWSAYGYSRPTTPLLDSIKDDIIWLGNATSDANLTAWAVPILLTGMAPVDFDPGKVRGNIFDLAKEAGYRTAWLVNQDIGISESVGVVADSLVYPPDFKSNVNGRHTLDEVLIPGFQKELTKSGHPRFIGIHMMGSHWEYYRRFSAAFQRFGSRSTLSQLSMVSVLTGSTDSESALVDAYDDTVLYTDWFLHTLIKDAEALDVPATLMFFPDHGEDLTLLDGATGHGAPAYTPHAFEIPAFVWVNKAYRQRYPDRVASLESNADKDIRTHNVFDTEADLMGIQWPEESRRRSFASRQFSPDSSMKRVAGGVLVEPSGS